MVDGAVVDAANARTNERKEARMHEKFVTFVPALPIYGYVFRFAFFQLPPVFLNRVDSPIPIVQHIHGSRVSCEGQDCRVPRDAQSDAAVNST